jgi:hypothetical protein
MRISPLAAVVPLLALSAFSPATAPLGQPQVCVTMISISGHSGDKGTPIRVCLPVAQIPDSAPAAEPTVKPNSGHPRTTGSETGYPTVGKFLFKVAHLVSFNCTGTVISALSGRPAFVLLAAHCLYGDYHDVTYRTGNWRFVPEWHDNTAPLGTWSIDHAYYPSLWPDDCHLGHCDFNAQYDFALLVIKPLNSQLLGSVTGSDGWAVNEPDTVSVTVAGIPGNSSETLVSRAVSHTVHPAGYDARQASTPGFGAGSSGGPWFYSYSATEKIGDVLGDTGGYQEGGDKDSPSYSPFLTGYFAAMVAAASGQEQ